MQVSMFLIETPHHKKMFQVDAALYPVPVCDEFKLYCKKYWKCAVKKLTMSFNDYMGGCKMGPYWDKEAVVNSRLQVTPLYSSVRISMRYRSGKRSGFLRWKLSLAIRLKREELHSFVSLLKTLTFNLKLYLEFYTY